jgi:VanZ family protein
MLRQTLRVWRAPLLMALAIFVQSSFASPAPFPDWPDSDKWLHLAVYALLAALVFRSAAVTWPDSPAWRLAVAAFVATSLYGATDEWHQYHVPGRWADPLDWWADTSGALVGALLALARHRPPPPSRGTPPAPVSQIGPD